MALAAQRLESPACRSRPLPLALEPEDLRILGPQLKNRFPNLQTPRLAPVEQSSKLGPLVRPVVPAVLSLRGYVTRGKTIRLKQLAQEQMVPAEPMLLLPRLRSTSEVWALKSRIPERAEPGPVLMSLSVRQPALPLLGLLLDRRCALRIGRQALRNGKLLRDAWPRDKRFQGYGSKRQPPQNAQRGYAKPLIFG